MEDQLNRWAEHFEETLNRPDPDEQSIIEDIGFKMVMRRGHIFLLEIVEVIRHAKDTK